MTENIGYEVVQCDGQPEVDQRDQQPVSHQRHGYPCVLDPQSRI